MGLEAGELRTAFDEKESQYKRANGQLKDLLNALLDDLSQRYGVRAGLLVLGEPKSFESFYKKATEKYDCQSVDEAFEKVRDLARVRVICHTLDDCFALVDLLREQEVVYVDESSIEMWIEEPSETGYRAIHLEVSVDVPVGTKKIATPCEVQIRTALQEAWGHYTHADFYKGVVVPELVRNLMRELSDLLYYTDRHAGLLINEIARARSEQLETAKP